MVINATDATFEQEVLQSQVPVLVDFWAPWCAPCKTQSPVIDAVDQEMNGSVKFVKVNIDETDIAQHYGIRSVPTLKLFQNGKAIASHAGMLVKPRLNEFIASNTQ